MSHVLALLRKTIETDPEFASGLMDEIAREVYHDQVEKHADAVLGVLQDHWGPRFAQVKQSIAKSYVAKTVDGQYPSDSYQKAADWVADLEDLIFKADFDERKHRRGEGGRFVRFINGRPAASLQDVDPRRLSPAARRLKDNGGDLSLKDMDPEAKKLHLAEQGEWDDANRALAEFKRSFPGSKDGVNAVFTFKTANGGTDSFSVPLDGKIDPTSIPQYDLQSSLAFVELTGGSTAETKRQLATFNAIGAATGSVRAANVVGSLKPDQMRAFGADLGDQDPNKSRLTRFFNRLKSGGGVLSSNDATRQYGQMAELAGQFGSEADAVLGPAARRAAYRYRGTEKQPDQELRMAFGSRELQALDAVAGSRNPEMRDEFGEKFQASGGRDGKMHPAAGAAAHRLRESSTRGDDGDPMSEDELRMKVRADIATAHMIRTLPDDPFVAELSVASGQVLPSQGIVVDADGDLVAQSVGYAEDHYLPFDLKNLRRLKGGQYVRTRMQGGMTGEDVYTLAQSGARMGTVVSSSGVFTLEMDPNYRGARANPERGRQIYDRYLKILDAVDQSGLYVKDLPPERLEAVKAKAKTLGVDQKRDKERWAQLVDAEREDSVQLTSEERDSIVERVENEVDTNPAFRSLNTRQRAAEAEVMVRDRMEEAQDEKLRPLRLNAEGYNLALKTLQQQFPYFIRTASFEPLKSRKDGEGFFKVRGLPEQQAARQRPRASDRGYVRPGGIKSQSTQEGYYATAGPRSRKGQSEAGPTAVAAAGEQAAAGDKPTEAGAKPAADKPKTAATRESSGAMGQALHRRSEEYAAKASEQVQILNQVNTQLTRASMGNIPGVKNADQGMQSAKWADVPQGARLPFLMDASAEQWADATATDPDGVTAALNDRKGIEAYVRQHVIDSLDADGENIKALGFKGVDSVDTFVEFVAGTAQKAADYARLGSGEIFRTQLTPETAYDTNAPAMLPGMETVNSAERLQAFASKGDMQRAIGYAVEAGMDEDQHPRTLGQIDQAFKARLTQVGKLKGFTEKLQARVYDQGEMDTNKASEGALRESGVKSLDELNALTGQSFTTAEQVGPWMAQGGLDQVATDLQQGWSLATMTRVVDEDGGGGALPFGVAPLLALESLQGGAQVPQLIVKARSSRRVVRLAPGRGTQALAKAVRPDLPPLPARFRPAR